MADEDAVLASEPHLVEFLKLLRLQAGASTVHLIAHSMGARLLSLALNDLAREGQAADSVRFTQIVLTAPDIDADVFRGLAHEFRRLAERVTLYASSEDLALKVSEKLHATPRAGESGDRIVIMPELDTIDVSTVDTSLSGHSYFAENESVL